jgi:hypothetical protein
LRALFAVSRLVFLTVLLAALLDLLAVAFDAAFVADFLTSFFDLVLLAFAARFEPARFLRGA